MAFTCNRKLSPIIIASLIIARLRFFSSLDLWLHTGYRQAVFVRDFSPPLAEHLVKKQKKNLNPPLPPPKKKKK